MLRTSAGEDEDVNLDGDIQDTPFPELGYDSLAILQLMAIIERQHGIELGDDVLLAETPGEFLGLVNSQLNAIGSAA